MRWRHGGYRRIRAGSDPRLSVALADANPAATDPLDRNWRSTPAVMEFVNALGAGLFGARYTPLTPTRDPVEGPALELLVMTKSRSVRNGSRPTSARFDALDQIEDMSAVLASARLIHTPGFAAPEVQRRFVEDRRADFEANARNLLYVALTRARDRLILEWPAFLKERDAEAPGAACLFHVLEDSCSPSLGADKLRVAGVDCPAIIRTLLDHASFTTLSADVGGPVARFGAATPLPPIPQSRWRVNPSQLVAAGHVPPTRGIDLGQPWSAWPSNAARGTALHLALWTFLARPDLAARLPAANGLDDDALMKIAERARRLKDWLSTQGYVELRCEIPVLGITAAGAELSGTIDLLALGPQGCLLIDHKTGGPGDGLGPYWPQLSAYAALVPALSGGAPLQGIGIFWIDHGRLDLAIHQEAVQSQ